MTELFAGMNPTSIRAEEQEDGQCKATAVEMKENMGLGTEDKVKVETRGASSGYIMRRRR